MIKRTIENLKERPHQERRAVASLVAYGVIGLLLLAWAVSFFTRLGNVTSPTPSTTTASDTE